MIPGEIRTRPEPLEMNSGRERKPLVVVNGGDRPIQVGSHLHFSDANPALQFDREAAVGFRLDIPAGTSVRFEPGVSRTVDLVALGGRRHVPGLQLRDRPLEGHAVEREPRRVVPFGTPNTESEKPPRAMGMHIRISDDAPDAADVTGESEEEPS
ncbi:MULTISPECIES: urease subunit beta [unclassified Pseudactinotalea]|uniref:urease subunit beta n=1 Tax=unclassified Pseudactinotalea TaxID=2649176 RepID=UPI00128B8B6D|nr:urease subunit beta [Pseudactinotalea sp. HY160]QGH69629.1 urease subunit beta [Pseudactinotalea sp. HY158]